MFFNTKTTFLIGFLLIIIALLGIILVLKKPAPTTPSLPTYSPLPTPTKASPEPSPTVIQNPQIKLIPGEDQRILQKIENRQPLSVSDLEARSKLTKQADQKTGIVKSTSSYLLEYLPAGDFFITQILIVDVDKAKLDTVEWLKEQNLSDAGICNLPLYFYLSETVSQQLIGTDFVFNRLPKGC